MLKYWTFPGIKKNRDLTCEMLISYIFRYSYCKVHKQCTYYIRKIKGKKDISISLYYYSIPGGRVLFLPIQTLPLPIFLTISKQEVLQSRF